MQLLTHEELKKLVQLRRWLHQYPELSGKEKETASRINKELENIKPDKVVPGIGGYGLAAVFSFADKGPTILVRADMDALPIEEANAFSHKSQNEGVSHSCGHDGHSTMLTGLAMALRKNPLQKGRIVLLFQPEEETGQGAAKVIEDEAFKIIQPDMVLALHNLPGFKKGHIVIKDGPFAAASTGMIVKITGLSSHAAHPEQGNSPARMLAHSIVALQDIPKKKDTSFQDYTLVTIIHAKLGEVAFGTSPGKAVLMATLRTFLNDDMDELKKQCIQIIQQQAKEQNLKVDISWTEDFPATQNDKTVTDNIRRAAKELDMDISEISQPFRWSEDFGHFTSRYPGALFGLGSGIESPGLHNNDYDFPDDIISEGVHIFYETLRLMTNRIDKP